MIMNGNVDSVSCSVAGDDRVSRVPMTKKPCDKTVSKLKGTKSITATCRREMRPLMSLTMNLAVD